MMSTDAPNIADENRSAASAFAGKATFIATPVNAPRPGFVSSLPWTMLMIVVGFLTVATCVYLPLREENRQLENDLNNLGAQSQYVKDQVAANAAFLERVHSDPTLTHRLLMRMTNKPIPGTEFLDAEPVKAFNSSPFEITRVDPPAPPAAYQSDIPQPLRGVMSNFRSRSILLCAGVFLMGTALVLGTTKEKASTAS